MSHFTRRHYESIALSLQAIHPGDDTDTIDHEARLEMWRDVREELAVTFARDNNRFQGERFKAACLPGNNVRVRTRYSVAV